MLSLFLIQLQCLIEIIALYRVKEANINFKVQYFLFDHTFIYMYSIKLKVFHTSQLGTVCISILKYFSLHGEEYRPFVI